eukprot:364341-Chlamydomonas_euryale.AAC.23
MGNGRGPCPVHYHYAEQLCPTHMHTHHAFYFHLQCFPPNRERARVEVWHAPLLNGSGKRTHSPIGASSIGRRRSVGGCKGQCWWEGRHEERCGAGRG